MKTDQKINLNKFQSSAADINDLQIYDFDYLDNLMLTETTEPCIDIISADVVDDQLMVEMSNTGFEDGDHYHAYINDALQGMYYTNTFAISLDCDGEDHELSVFTVNGLHVEYGTTCSTDLASFTASIQGDINGDGTINVLDIVQLVTIVLNGGDNGCADMNGDGTLNVLDLVQTVNIILDDSIDLEIF